MVVRSTSSPRAMKRSATSARWEEALRGDPGIGLEARRQRRRVVEAGAAVVGDQAAVGAGRGAGAEGDVVAEPGQGRGEAEGEELQRHRPGQLLHRLARSRR